MGDSLKDILKKINKDKDGMDRVDYLRHMPKSYLTKGYLPTGSVFVDYLIKGHNLTGMSLVTGWESTGKSSFLLLGAREAQIKFPDKTPVIFDGEGTVTPSYLDRMGVDADNLIVVKGSELESTLDTMEMFSKADDVSMIGIDSIKAFYSTIDESKSAEDYSIGGTAKRWNTRMPIIKSNCFKRGIPIICIHQWRQDPGKMMGDNRVLSGGMWIKYMPDLHIDLSKKALIFDGSEPIGHNLHIRIKKSKSATYDPKEVYELPFFYTGGFIKYSEYAAVFVAEGIVKKGGAWYELPTGEKLQGMTKLSQFLEDNEEYLEELKGLL